MNMLNLLATVPIRSSVSAAYSPSRKELNSTSCMTVGLMVWVEESVLAVVSTTSKRQKLSNLKIPHVRTSPI